jgi:hypothetical protein
MSFIRMAARTAAIHRNVLTTPRTCNQLLSRAGFSAAAGLSKDVIQTRVLDVLKGFEKVDPTKVWLYSYSYAFFQYTQACFLLLVNHRLFIREGPWS